MRIDSLLDPAVEVTVTGIVENNGEQMTVITVKFQSGQLPFLDVQVDGLPFTCMDLSNVFIGDASDGSVPTPVFYMPFVQQPDRRPVWGDAFHLQPGDESLEPPGDLIPMMLFSQR
ncbi:hypothetical protein BDV11DRAFT_183459 [Aspergillus similis]